MLQTCLLLAGLVPAVQQATNHPIFFPVPFVALDQFPHLLWGSQRYHHGLSAASELIQREILWLRPGSWTRQPGRTACAFWQQNLQL
jgi:hypothetical protein